MSNYKLGLVSVSFRGNTPQEILSAMKEAELSYIEWGSDVHAPCDDIEKLKRIAALQQENGIECCSYGTYFRIGENSAEDIKKYISAAKFLGTNVLRLWCGTKGSAQYTESESRLLFAECRTLARIAEDSGVTLCMECHNNTYTDSVEAALRLMHEVDSKSFRMYWQPNQYRTIGENLYYAEQIAPYTRHLHVFNWKGDERYPLHEAVELWRQYISLCPGDKTLLLEFMPDNDILSLSREADALREIRGG